MIGLSVIAIILVFSNHVFAENVSDCVQPQSLIIPLESFDALLKEDDIFKGKPEKEIARIKKRLTQLKVGEKIVYNGYEITAQTGGKKSKFTFVRLKSFSDLEKNKEDVVQAQTGGVQPTPTSSPNYPILFPIQKPKGWLFNPKASAVEQYEDAQQGDGS